METDEGFKKARGNLCMPIVLVSAKHEDISNVMTLAWSSPSSFIPPLLNISVGTTRYTHDLIMKSKEFAVNVAADDQVDLAIYCGNISGNEVNKFKEKSIATHSARVIKAPLIDNCAANIECKVIDHFSTGDHTVFVGEIVDYEEHVSKKPLIRFRGMFFNTGNVLAEDEHPAKV